jgi:hypothetical protein
MTFLETVQAKYPKTEVLYLNGNIDEADIEGWNGMGVEVPGPKRAAYRYRDNPINRERVELRLLEWLEKNYPHDQ